MWIACDSDGQYVSFGKKPYRDKWFGFWTENSSGSIDYHGNDESSIREHKMRRHIVSKSKYKNVCLDWNSEPVYIDSQDSDSTVSLEDVLIERAVKIIDENWRDWIHKDKDGMICFNFKNEFIKKMKL